MTKKRILIADDHSAIRSGIKHILSFAFSEIEFGETTDAQETITKIEKETWDILILDIDFPGRSGLEVLKYLKDENISLPVLVFSFHKEDQVAIRAIRSGAWAFLSKDVTDKELITAIKMLLSGRKYISPSLSDQIVDQMQKPQEVPVHELLSSREFQTLLMIAQGKAITKIAEELRLSVSTIHTYRARLLEKMQVTNNAQLTSYVFRYKLLCCLMTIFVA
jgi:two-component system, NarL family, invasion response regulator UvrY